MAELLELRSSIDNIDAALVHLLAELQGAAAGRLKAEHLRCRRPILSREKVQIERSSGLAADAWLDPDCREIPELHHHGSDQVHHEALYARRRFPK